MATATASRIDPGVIPVIDIGPLRDGTDPDAVARALREASQTLGFIYITGHGIPDHVIEAARETAYDFFRAPEQAKESVRVSEKHRGWIDQGGAKMQDDVAPDLKESFVWGYQDAAGDTPADHALRGPNQWPGAVPEMERRAMAYFEGAQDVAHHLMRGFARGLDLPENFFLRTAARPLSRASYVYYPSQPATAPDGQFGVGPHTDFGVLTVLCQDSVGGLQIQDVNGDWIHAPPIPGTLIVNVADLLTRWTDGAFKSTPHRVINDSGRERLSLVLAFDPDPETVIDARDVFGPDHPVADDPITCGDYLVWRFNKAFSYREEETPKNDGIDLAIGSALRGLRDRRALSARQLAANSGVSAAMISRIENGQVSPSISTLNALAKALDVPLVSLFRETGSGHSDFTHVKKGEGLKSTRIVDRHVHEFVNLAFHRRRDLQFEAHTITLVRQDARPPAYIGHGVIFLYALEGEARYRYGQTDIILKAGDSLSVDAELSHGFQEVLSPEFTFLSVQAERQR